jgi:hypothetical protein
MTPIQKLAKLALENPELREELMPIIKAASAYTQVTGPETTEIYEKKVDHGYDQPLSGGHDIMKRLQDQFLIEQGREPRDKNPRLAATHALQRGLIAVLLGAEGRKVATDVITKYAAATNSTVVVNAAVEDIIKHAVAVALDPQTMGQVIAKHTAKEQP